MWLTLIHEQNMTASEQPVHYVYMQKSHRWHLNRTKQPAIYGQSPPFLQVKKFNEIQNLTLIHNWDKTKENWDESFCFEKIECTFFWKKSDASFLRENVGVFKFDDAKNDIEYLKF